MTHQNEVKSMPPIHIASSIIAIVITAFVFSTQWRNKKKPTTAYPKCDREFSERLLLHIDNLIHTRVNAFLVVQSVFLVALTRAWNTPLANLLVFCGTIFTGLLWYMIARLNRGFGWLSKVVESNKIYKDYAHVGSGMIQVPSWLIIAWVIPIAMLGLWVRLSFMLP